MNTVNNAFTSMGRMSPAASGRRRFLWRPRPYRPLPAVRRFLFHLQRDTAAVQDVIMDGRDIGTVVLPDAP